MLQFCTVAKIHLDVTFRQQEQNESGTCERLSTNHPHEGNVRLTPHEGNVRLTPHEGNVRLNRLTIGPNHFIS